MDLMISDDAAVKPSSFQPQPATTVDETGLPRGLVFELILKRAFLEGTTTLRRLVTETKLGFGVVNTVFRNLQKEQLCEIKGMVGDDYELTLTTQGLRMAEEAYRKNQYCGPAPVPLAEYRRAVCAQAFRPRVTQESLAERLSDLVVSPELVRSLGSAIMSGGAIFLYGPTGNGKTSIAERLHRVFEDLVYIPYAVEVSGHILSVYDAVVHHAVADPPPDGDYRWALCRRPFLSVGGELRAEMLEPRLDEVTRICLAPLPMLANNGILVIDDFGRQQMKPRDLLNRWIVPLDRRVDYFSLWSGVRFSVPFELMVVFATNVEISQLAEEAFMRRIKNKIRVDAITQEMFGRILERVCQERGIECSAEMEDYLWRRCVEEAAQGVRACFPQDLLDIVCGVAGFEQRRATLKRSDLDYAMKIYFAQ